MHPQYRYIQNSSKYSIALDYFNAIDSKYFFSCRNLLPIVVRLIIKPKNQNPIYVLSESP